MLPTRPKKLKILKNCNCRPKRIVTIFVTSHTSQKSLTHENGPYGEQRSYLSTFEMFFDVLGKHFLIYARRSFKGVSWAGMG